MKSKKKVNRKNKKKFILYIAGVAESQLELPMTFTARDVEVIIMSKKGSKSARRSNYKLHRTFHQ